MKNLGDLPFFINDTNSVLFYFCFGLGKVSIFICFHKFLRPYSKSSLALTSEYDSSQMHSSRTEV
jgi:hypothetical protein